MSVASTVPAAGPSETVLPPGTVLRVPGSVTVADGGRTLVGGDPPRLAYLGDAAQALLRHGRELRVVDRRSAMLARRLADGGLAHVVAGPPPVSQAAVTAVVPVRDRPLPLARLLAALEPGLRVVVVDDGSADPGATAAVARRHGADLVRRAVPGGPAAARNTGLRRVRTAFAVFVDSDVVPEPGWLEALLGQMVDPAVGLVAPRVLALADADADAGGGWVAGYERARSSLDLGPDPARVQPRGRVSYLPSACLLGRVEALAGGFDERMHVAEDVDLVWRAHAAGWRVRYCPQARVRHEHRVGLVPWLTRKAFYGTGAAALAARHGRAVAPVAMPAWAAVACAALAAQRRWSLPVAGAATGLAVGGLVSRLQQSDHPVRTAAALVPLGLVAALRQTAAGLTRHWWPVAVAAAVPSRRARRAVLVAAIAGGLDDWRRQRPALDPVRFVVARRLDDLAYGTGLWWGALRCCDLRALCPDLSGRGVGGSG